MLVFKMYLSLLKSQISEFSAASVNLLFVVLYFMYTFLQHHSVRSNQRLSQCKNPAAVREQI